MAKIWKFGKDVDTDQILPGRFAPFMLPEGKDVKDYAFIEARPDFAKHAEAGDIIVADENFGCGSSREYAPEALRRRQIGGIIAPSFARIFFRNAVNLGIPLFESDEVQSAVADGDDVSLDVDYAVLKLGDGSEIQLPQLPTFATEIIRVGGLTTYVRKYGKFPGE